jgi:hypothetical protein
MREMGAKSREDKNMRESERKDGERERSKRKKD